MKFQWTKNLERGSEGGVVYWRVLNRLLDDPIASMLSEDTLKGLAGAFYDRMVNDEHRVVAFNSTAVRVSAKALIRRTPLSILKNEAIEYLAHVIWSAIYPENVAMEGNSNDYS